MKTIILILSVLFLASCGGRSEEDMVQELSIEVELSNGCGSASECTVIHLGCPLGCSAAVNVDQVDYLSEVAEKLVRQYQAGGTHCSYSCIPMAASCLKNKCELVNSQ